MRIKTSNLNDPKHTELVSCVSWMSPDEVLSIGDDRQIYKWNLVTSDTTKFSELPEGFYPTDIHWYPKSSGNKSGSDVFLVSSADGKIQWVNGKSGRLEKCVDAHRGACLCVRWSFDGAGIVTGGEDGAIKIWSRSGMLRSTLSQNSDPVYSLFWSPDSSSVLYSMDRFLIIKPLTPNSKPLQWRAHEGVVLCLDWSPSAGRIISGAEDCRYKVWDQYGRQLYSSSQHDYPITSLSWSGDGLLFAVGSFNTLRLCDKIGWSHSLDKPETGSIYKIAWSNDGTQLAGACGRGHVIFAHVIDKRLEWRNYEATVTGRKSISLRNVTDESREKLEFHDRIIKVSLDYAFLIVATTSQVYIYSTKNWNTPNIIELKEGSVSLLIQTERQFLIVETNAIYSYSYDGRFLCSPKWPGMRPETLNHHTISLSPDTIAIRDQTSEEKSIYFIDASNGKMINDGKPFVHRLEITEISLDQTGLSNERKCAFVDKNRDLFLINVRKYGSAPISSGKLGSMVQSLKWSCDCNMLATILDSRFTVFLYPSIIYVDKNLMGRTLIEKESLQEFGKYPSIIGFHGNSVSIRRADGSLVTTFISPYPSSLYGFAISNRWSDAIRLCRFVKDDMNAKLWACLAGMSTYAKHLDTAEVAYCALHEVDKVHYIQYVKELPVKEARNAEMAIFTGHFQDGENILLQSGLVFRAILLNIHLHQWERALDLAIRHKTHVDTVLAYRIKHLTRCEKEETIPKYIQYIKNVEIDWEKISLKIEGELERERLALCSCIVNNMIIIYLYLFTILHDIIILPSSNNMK
ncbi:intraflagellar transport protein 80 homolog [Lepeophtheirus salmonis]|uniref:intraflagellar transport protein 80 homolog n=1 Tax=Lepeophtheirus salmonis TaxID=72036 RepID=UPI003AF36B3B